MLRKLFYATHRAIFLLKKSHRGFFYSLNVVVNRHFTALFLLHKIERSEYAREKNL